MQSKLEYIEQGSEIMEEYYDDIETTLFHSGLEECEEAIMDRFLRELNHEIQDILLHK